MKTTGILTGILQLAKTVESMVQMETLSKQLLQKVRKLNTTTEVHAAQKCHHSKDKHFLSNSRSTSGRKSSSWDKDGKKCGNCGHYHLPKQCPAYGKECFKCKRRIISQNFVEVQIKSQVVGLAILNIFQGKTLMK